MRTAVFWSRALAVGLGGAAVLLLAYGQAGRWLMERADRQMDRDPATGVLIGAEARDLGPTDAPGAVLFVHGFAGAGSNFGPLPEMAAAEGWRVRVMRLPGHGLTHAEFARIDADGLIAAVRRELAGLRNNHQTVVLAGHSMGGALCALVAAEGGVDGLVLGAPYFGVTHRWYYGLRPETWTRLTSPFIRQVYKGQAFTRVRRKEAKPSILSYPWLPARASLVLIEVGKRARRPETLKRVTCPVLVLHAPGDSAASPEAARTAFEQMATAEKRWTSLPRSDHHIFFDYDREAVFAEVLAFLAQRQGI